MNYWFFCFERYFGSWHHSRDIEHYLHRSIDGLMIELADGLRIDSARQKHVALMDFMRERAIRYVITHSKSQFDNTVITTYAELSPTDAVEYRLRFDAPSVPENHFVGVKVLGFSDHYTSPIDGVW